MSSPLPPEAEHRIEGASLIATLATCADDRPNVAPVWYAYSDGVVEVLIAGRKLADLRENPRAALSIQRDTDGRAEWAVILRGTATVIEDEAEIEAAARRINPKYGAGTDAWSENVLARIEVGSATYRNYEGT